MMINNWLGKKIMEQEYETEANLNKVEKQEQRVFIQNLKRYSLSDQQKINLEAFQNNQFIGKPKNENFSKTFVKKSKLGLKYYVKEQKIHNLAENFKKKLQRNNTNRVPVEENLFSFNEKRQICSLKGLHLSKMLESILNLMFVCHFLSTFFVFLMEIAFFQEIENLYQFRLFKIFSIFFIGLQASSEVCCQKNIQGKNVQKIHDLFLEYVRSKLFFIDLICLVTLILGLSVSWPQLKYIQLLFFLKSSQFYQRVLELESYFMKNFQREQYWGVAKVFILNFFVAHLIAVIFLIISDGQPNWMDTLGLGNLNWKDKYAFAYFWAMSTMLGFGNAVPSNPREAMLISFIQCFSCILLAYILNHVGTLLANITKKNEEKIKKFQIARRITEENEISQELFAKISNHIKQTDEIEKKTVFKSDNEFLTGLPSKLKNEFFKESNKNTFSHLPFFGGLCEKTLIALAKNIEVKIAHPQEVIFSKKDPFRFIILKKGTIGSFSSILDSEDRSVLMNKVSVDKKSRVRLLDLSIFQENIEMNYFLKALDFTILYELDFDETKKIIQNSHYDYEGFCEIRDRSKHIIDEFQVFNCQHCEMKHSKLRCPRLHYMPIKSMVVQRYLFDCKVKRNSRKHFNRNKNNIKIKPLKNFERIFKKLENVLISKTIKDTLAFKRQNPSITRINTDETYGESLGLNNRAIFNIVQTLKSIETESCKNLDNKMDQLKQIIKSCMKLGNSREDQDFWSIECDTLHNFKFYFIDWNPSNYSSFSIKLSQAQAKTSRQMGLNLKRQKRRKNAQICLDIGELQRFQL